MTCAFLGGSLGSWLGVRAYGTLGWLGVCGLVAVLAIIALIRHLCTVFGDRPAPEDGSRVVAVTKPFAALPPACHGGRSSARRR
jgi:hypothetical protein